ncbi:MAG TPA: hypothetical protein VM695_15920 [Phycisphaerae bacterium]|nr:hypothetical protein [Phycisphaerae bacterium]
MSKATKHLVLCIDNEGYEVSLETNKLYLMLPGAREDHLDMIRVIDESGEGYLYPKELFAILPADALSLLRFPTKTQRRILKSLQPT